MMIIVEEAVGEACKICDKDADYHVPVIDASLCRRCAKRLAAVLKQGVQS